jgi:hypothetical protein
MAGNRSGCATHSSMWPLASAAAAAGCTCDCNAPGDGPHCWTPRFSGCAGYHCQPDPRCLRNRANTSVSVGAS